MIFTIINMADYSNKQELWLVDKNIEDYERTLKGFKEAKEQIKRKQLEEEANKKREVLQKIFDKLNQPKSIWLIILGQNYERPDILGWTDNKKDAESVAKELEPFFKNVYDYVEVEELSNCVKNNL